MATLKRICRLGRTRRTINSIRTPFSSPSLANRSVCYGNYENVASISTMASEKTRIESVSEFPEFFSMLPVFLAGGFGMGMLNISHADADEAEVQAPSAASPFIETPPSGFENLEKIVRQERLRLEELLKNKGMLRGSYPPFSVAVKGQKVTVKFQIPPTCEASHLIVDIVSHLGLTAEKHGGGSDMVLRAWDSSAAWQMTLNSPRKKEVQTDTELLGDKDDNGGDLCVFIFQSLINSENAEIEFIKKGSFSTEELDALVSALKLAGSKASERKPRGYPARQGNRIDSAADKSVAALEAMGVRVFGLKESPAISSTGDIAWDNIAGYDQQKREIEDTILLVLRSPEVYDNIVRGTRCKFESNRPRAVLFEGPPGTGKTSCARIIANQARLGLLQQSSAQSWLGSQGSSSGLIVKKTIRVDIPVDKYPTFNFVGRLLGPRGNSLKRVEANTECRVLIRGHGSIKDPTREEMMRGKPGFEHLNEPLHILVEAELPAEIIDARLMQAREILEDLLRPVDESQDFFKKQQLRELAMINGTLRDEGSHMSGSVSPFNDSLGMKRAKTRG